MWRPHALEPRDLMVRRLPPVVLHVNAYIDLSTIRPDIRRYKGPRRGLNFDIIPPGKCPSESHEVLRCSSHLRRRGFRVGNTRMSEPAISC